LDAKVFRNYLFSLGITKENLAELVEVQNRTVRRWATGYHDVPQDVEDWIFDLENRLLKDIAAVLQNKKPASNFSDLPPALQNQLKESVNRRVKEALRLKRETDKC